MKKLFFNLFLLSLMSCSKNESKLVNSNESSEYQTNVGSKNLRTSGETTYYSIDEELNIVYKMKLKTLADGTLEIKRDVSNGNHNGQQIVIVNQISDELSSKTIDKSTIEINSSEEFNTYLIPFVPTDSIQSFIAGGGDKWEASCKCSVGSGANATCQASLTKSANGTLTAACSGKNCQTCQLKLTKVKSGAKREFKYSGGFLILTARGVVEN